MKTAFSGKEKILIVFTAVICASNMFMKAFMDGIRIISETQFGDLRHSRSVILLNYMLTLHYIFMFFLLMAAIVICIGMSIKSTAFLSLYREGKHGKFNDLSNDEDKYGLIDSFENTNDFVDTVDAFAIVSGLCMVSALFCSFYDVFKGLRLWGTDPSAAGRRSVFIGWVYEVFAVPNTDLSDYAINWLLPMFVLIIALFIYTYHQFYTAKKAFCEIFPEVPEEGLFNPLILTRVKRRYDTDEEEELFSTDYTPEERKNLFLRQEDIDNEENSFFAEENKPPKIDIIRDLGENDGDQELIPEGLDMSRLKFKPTEGEKEELIPCPLCGSLNPKNAEECFFCGGKTDE